jgi:hypothetical protein
MSIALIALAIFPNKNHHYPGLKIDIYIIKNAFFGDLLHTCQGDFL